MSFCARSNQLDQSTGKMTKPRKKRVNRLPSSLLRQKIHWKSIWGQVGLLLHIPAGMGSISLIICTIFQEWFALIPMTTLALIGFGSGQFLYRMFSTQEQNTHLWDAMIIASLGWLSCSLLAAIPFYWIAVEQLGVGVNSPAIETLSHPINALFESISGYTSTGLTMLQKPGSIPQILQWWRSFLEWTGGIGLVVFILSLTHLNRVGYQLYYAEAHTEKMSKNMKQTAYFIWVIYLLYTCIAVVLFYHFGMPLWEAINHGLTVISTGGFTLSNENFQSYSMGIKMSAILMMIIASMSFTIHFQIIREGKWKILFKNIQQRFLYTFVIGGAIIIVLLNIWTDTREKWINSVFEWISALTTCGFSALDLSLFNPMTKLFLIIGMFVGGATGSTVGGLKIRRLLYLFSGVFLRLKTLTQKKERQITKQYKSLKDSEGTEIPGIDLPKTEKSERLYTASILFFLWCLTLLTGWFFILKWTPNGKALDALFDVVSAMSNVGLSSGLLTPEFSSFGKCIFMLLMWIGRLEIIPAIILFLSLPISFNLTLQAKRPS